MDWQQVALTVEVPINRKDARRRRLPSNLAKLIVDGSPHRSMKECIGTLAEVVDLWRGPVERIYASPINAFEHAAPLNSPLGHPGWASELQWLDDENYVVAIDGHVTLAQFLGRSESEAAVMIYSTDIAAVIDTLRYALAARGNTNQYEAPFIERMQLHNGFVFYAESHRSIEVLGTSTYVMTRCLPPIAAGWHTC